MTPASANTRRRTQAGYTLLMVVFMVASLSILALAAAPNILTEGRRERETEMVWRGEQYARAIGLYYRKFGKYPTKIEDLTKATNGVRFLREAYPDPMNKEDGSWRFIYAGPNGQLIGSLRPSNMLQNALSSQGIPGLSPLGGAPQPPSGPGAMTNQQPGIGGATQSQQGTAATSPNPLESQPQPFTGAVLGGNITGVGSKIKKPSIRIYMGGDNYQQWEFIWSANGLGTIPGQTPGQTPVNPNANPSGAPNGAPPTGTDPNAPGGQPPPQTPIIN